MNFFFMEMNTRLQVEHPVTEAITGLDLVEWQFRVAFGEPLPLQQDQLKIDGHAIEARICAESPTITSCRPPDGSTLRSWPAHGFPRRGPVRIDTGSAKATRSRPYYDSMIAKLIVHGDTREQALARLERRWRRPTSSG